MRLAVVSDVVGFSRPGCMVPRRTGMRGISASGLSVGEWNGAEAFGPSKVLSFHSSYSPGFRVYLGQFYECQLELYQANLGGVSRGVTVNPLGHSSRGT